MLGGNVISNDVLGPLQAPKQPGMKQTAMPVAPMDQVAALFKRQQLQQQQKLQAVAATGQGQVHQVQVSQQGQVSHSTFPTTC